jgi:hypothetical protein
MTDTNPIFAEIEALLDDDTPRALDEIEDTLTTGYAAALALEADRWRIERRISALATELGGEADFELHRAEEMVELAQRLSSADADLIRLRDVLGSLRERADAARAAA